LTTAYSRNGNATQALKVSEKGLQLDPENIDLLHSDGIIRTVLNIDDPKAAISHSKAIHIQAKCMHFV
jgi:hypothetical protein